MAEGHFFRLYHTMDTILGKKITQTQKYLTDGTRVPVTVLEVKDNPVVMVRTADRDGYVAVQLGYGQKKHATKAALGHSKKGANLDYAPYFLREVRMVDAAEVKEGDKISAATVLEAGDIVDVTGTSKGKGFAGVVKRHNFKGGPRTHGQSDRERAPGSIGQTTTPGRVYRGKRMAGKMGNDTVTIKNLTVVDVAPDQIMVAGLIPGITGSYIVIKKVGKDKKFPGMIKPEVASDAIKEEKEQIENTPEVPQETAQPTSDTTPIQEAPQEENVQDQSEVKEEKK